ncbi:hypothetical protein L1987_64912 [Smallanthus sonchifolius]|uniref:Uncharacterized protein n=1 Tax=Smallanthus sonchifolius TaxID=185202 RepID=A0ACB9BSW7_9ASTR|nr:hypothetical protein L1987_64912 [Smallanthus sonchifolius]
MMIREGSSDLDLVSSDGQGVMLGVGARDGDGFSLVYGETMVVVKRLCKVHIITRFILVMNVVTDSLSFQGFVLDPSKCSKLSIEEKRELVYEVSEWSHGSPELLQSWSRQEILQNLCAEMGKERKYTGLTKLKIIEQLLKIVSKKRSQDDIMMNLESSETDHQRSVNRHRKSDHHNRVIGLMDHDHIDLVDNNVVFCKNSACRANSDPPFHRNSCGMSCHLECAIKHEKSGIPKDGKNRGLDGSFYCVSCGEVNDLLGCWKKQMTVARDTRRVDILCYRVSLSQKLLAGTLQYQKLHNIVNEAMEKLEAGVGPLTGLPVKRARGIVLQLQSTNQNSPDKRDEQSGNYKNRRGLTPSTQYVLKVVYFENTRELGSKEITFHTRNDNENSPPTNSSSLSNPSSVEDEHNNVVNKQKDKEVAINSNVVIFPNTSRNYENNEKD